jgi:hypothetical protein
MRHCVVLIALVLATVFATLGCDNPSNRVFEAEPRGTFSDEDRKAIQAEIDQLAKGKDPARIDDSAQYSEALTKLTARGSKVESQLIENLGSHPDWAVRMGIIEVLGSIGTRACVDSVIKATGDPAALVALNANKLLEALTDHKLIPGPGQPTSPEGLAPVPQRASTDLALDAEEKLWSMWHQANGRLLHDTWLAWWKANRGTVVIK